jgi:hypothetical protein
MDLEKFKKLLDTFFGKEYRWHYIFLEKKESPEGKKTVRFVAQGDGKIRLTLEGPYLGGWVAKMSCGENTYTVNEQVSSSLAIQQLHRVAVQCTHA